MAKFTQPARVQCIGGPRDGTWVELGPGLGDWLPYVQFYNAAPDAKPAHLKQPVAQVNMVLYSLQVRVCQGRQYLAYAYCPYKWL